MVHPDVFPKQVVSPNFKDVVVKSINVSNQFKNEQEFESCDHMLQWSLLEASKQGFGVVIRSSDNGSDRRCTFMTMACERSGKYRPPLHNFKRDDTGSRKCECLFKLVGHPIVYRLMPEEKECVVNMTLNLVQLKNILATLKRKRPENISNIKQVYVSRYRTCDDGVTVRDIFWTRPNSIKLFNTFPIVFILDSTYKTNMKMCEKYHDLLKYVESIILDQVNEKIVCAWTDKVIHLGNTTTNRVESAHATLKNLLGNSKGDLCRDWDFVNQMIQNQHNHIQTSFGRSITVLEHIFKDNNLYSQLVDNISRAGFNYIFHEAKRANNVDFDSAKCGCTIVKTYGLPCACVIAKKVKLGGPIRMDEIFTHWRRLRFDDDGVMKDVKSNISILTKWELIQERFLKVDNNMKL
ncbi:uncharacterized protein LOC127137294 [Lathyrus oleraceus]|uniref:uncharacterized protein LOC127137294 n=1 Tax=Pisum sativum TaxID=3888 RepID=UPI0021CF0A42|nr:uncharacterized protein LOC127137294 [Pisum sativum]